METLNRRRRRPAAQIRGADPAPIGTPPAWISPQLAQLVKEAPDGDAWLHEIKYDGYRMLARRWYRRRQDRVGLP